MQPTINNIDFKFLDKLSFLVLKSAPYKIAFGGRGGGKSLAYAQAALILGAQRKLRVGCFREIQKSIDESVHELLSQEIGRLDLKAPDGSSFYTVGQNSITGANGTEFFFMGLRHNLNSIKSVANIDIAWVEEAATISKTAWDIFEPTIRRDPPFGPFGNGSEIWIGFNPELDTDETYKRFVLSPPEGAIVCKVNYSDNPFFPDILRRQMEAAKKRDYQDYLTVWEGECRSTLDGAIYANQILNAEKEGRITDVPWIRSKPVNTYWDLGKRDHTCIWFVQPVGSMFHLIDYYEDSGKDMTDYVRVLQQRGYTYGVHFLPHDGENEVQATNRTSASVLRSAGHRVRLVERVPKKSISIQTSRAIFDQCRFDRERTYEGVQRLRRYKFQIKDGNYSRDPLHDGNSDGADAFQQLGLHQKAEDEIIVAKKAKIIQFRSNSTTSWMG
jgi:phage terminase large subunit